VATAAETAGWDALFVWDHVVHDKRHRRSFGDPWMLLTAAALATNRIQLRAHRDGDEARPFEMVLGGPSPTDAAAARDLLGPLIEAGATWWDERRPIDEDIKRADLVFRRIEAGPPSPYEAGLAQAGPGSP
jgi:hypothetical protein